MYPFILAANGDPIARVNHDCSWSVRWDRVLDMAYDPPHNRRIAVAAYAKLLVAARDNFIVVPWDVSTKWARQWNHMEAVIDCIDRDPTPGEVQSTITYNGILIAQVNYDGSWSVDWEEIEDLARQNIDDFRALALIGLCRLFVAAKNRFWTTPWPTEEDDE